MATVDAVRCCLRQDGLFSAASRLCPLVDRACRYDDQHLVAAFLHIVSGHDINQSVATGVCFYTGMFVVGAKKLRC